ncbi:MAG TPA: hypothetical protein PLK35_03270 [Candidatus Moranbacteria bacterium]|nr:hypothetical protein [Candidatus Moranbacteria bacterium]
MKKIIKYIAAFFLAFLPLGKAQAVCPVCTVAVGAGVGLTRYLGIEDTIAGVWIGGMVVSLALWTKNWMAGKNKKFRYQSLILIIIYFLLVIVPLYYTGIMGHPFNRICGMDKILFGSFFGIFGFIIGNAVNLYIKEKNGGRAYFPFQKVVMAIAPLVILSVIFYIISKC